MLVIFFSCVYRHFSPCLYLGSNPCRSDLYLYVLMLNPSRSSLYYIMCSCHLNCSKEKIKREVSLKDNNETCYDKQRWYLLINPHLTVLIKNMCPIKVLSNLADEMLCMLLKPGSTLLLEERESFQCLFLNRITPNMASLHIWSFRF